MLGMRFRSFSRVIDAVNAASRVREPVGARAGLVNNFFSDGVTARNGRNQFFSDGSGVYKHETARNGEGTSLPLLHGDAGRDPEPSPRLVHGTAHHT